MLTPREIIAQAWAVTTTERALKRWGFASALFEILLDLKMLGYQVYFVYAYIIGKNVGLFDDLIWAYDHLPTWFFATLITLLITLIVVELFMPSLADGAIIGLTAKSHGKEKVQGGFVLALYNFFPLLAVHELFAFSSVPILISAISIILRYGAGLTPILIVVSVLVWLLSNIIKFFSSFTEPGIVVSKLGVFESGAKSVKLIMSYMPHVMFLTLLLIVITIRIVINTVVIVVLPFVVVGIGLLLTYVLNSFISYSIAGLIGFALIFVIAYFFTYLHVFRQAVWTIMYMEVIKEKELDKIG